MAGTNDTLCTPGDPTETEPGLPLSVSCGGVSSGLPQGQGLWVQQAWVWHKPSWRRSPLTHHRAARTYTGLGKQTLGGHKWNLVGTRTQEKGAVTPQETEPDLPMSVQESLAEAWSAVAWCRVRDTECSSACTGPFEGGHYLHFLHHSWPQVKQQGGNTAPPINRKLD